MNENEIMELEEVEVNNEPEFNEEERTESNFGFGVLVGGALTVAGMAAVKFARKLYAKHKAKKDIPTVVAEVVDDDAESEDIVDENDGK